MHRMNRSKLTLSDSPIRIKPNGIRLPAQEPLPKKEEVKFKIFYMKSKIEKLIIKLEKDKHENELKEHQCELDANFPQEMIHGSRISCLSMVIKELKKILNDSSAPIRTDEADKGTT